MKKNILTIGVTLIIIIFTLFLSSTMAIEKMITKETHNENSLSLNSNPRMKELRRWDSWLKPNAGELLQFGAVAEDDDSPELDAGHRHVE